MQEDVELDYVDKNKKMVLPFNVINEKDVGWDVQGMDIIDRYDIKSIKNYVPIQFDIKQMARGGFQNKIKSVKVFSPSKKGQVFSFEKHQVKIEPKEKGIRIFYYASDGPYGAFNLSGSTNRGFLVILTMWI